MANEIKIVINATDKASAELRKIEGLAGGGIGKAAKIGGAALAGLGVAAGAALASGVKTAANFEFALDAVGAVAQATESEMKGLREEALKIGKDTAFSASEAANAMEVLAASGIKATDIFGGAARAAVDLAAAGGTDMVTAADAAATSMSVWGLKTSEMTDVVNRLAGAANVSRFGVEDMSGAIAMGAGAAASAGVSFGDFSATIAAMAPSFSSGSDAGTSFKQFLNALTPNSEKAAEALASLGLMTSETTSAFFDANGQLRDMDQISQLLYDATKDLTEAQKAESLEIIFGSDAMRAAAAISKITGDEFKKMSDVMKNTDAQAVAAQRLGNLKGSLEALKGSIEVIQIEIGSRLIPILSKWASYLADKLPEGFARLDGYLKAHESEMDKIAEVTKDSANASVDALGSLTNYLKAEWGPVWAQAIETVKFFVWVVKTDMPYIKAVIKPVWDWVLISLGALKSAFEGFNALLAGDWKRSWQSFANAAIGAVQAIVDPSVSAFNAVARAYNATIGQIPKVANIPELSVDFGRFDTSRSAQWSMGDMVDTPTVEFGPMLQPDWVKGQDYGVDAPIPEVPMPDLGGFGGGFGGGGGGESMADAIEEEAEAAFSALDAMSAGFGQKMQALADSELFGSTGAELMIQLRDALNEGTPEAFAGLGDIAASLLGELQAAGMNEAGIAEYATGLMAALTEVIATEGASGVDRLRGILEDMYSMLTVLTAEETEEVLSALEQFQGAYAAAARGIAEEDALGKAGADIMESLRSSFAEGGPKALGQLGGEMAKLMDAMKEGLPADMALSLGHQLMSALETALTTGGQEAFDALAEILAKINGEMERAAEEAVATAQTFHDALAASIADLDQVAKLGSTGANIMDALSTAIATKTEADFIKVSDATTNMIEEMRKTLGPTTAKRLGTDLENAIAAVMNGEGSLDAVEKIINKINYQMELFELQGRGTAEVVQKSVESVSDNLTKMGKQGPLTDKELNITTFNAGGVRAQGDFFAQPATISSMLIGAMSAGMATGVGATATKDREGEEPTVAGSSQGGNVYQFYISGFVGSPDELVRLIEREIGRAIQ